MRASLRGIKIPLKRTATEKQVKWTDEQNAMADQGMDVALKRLKEKNRGRFNHKNIRKNGGVQKRS